MNKIFGNNLKKYREANNMTQQKFADLFNEYLRKNGIGFNYTLKTISMWESGERMPKTIDVLIHVAKFMGTTIDKLIADEVSDLNAFADNISRCRLDTTCIYYRSDILYLISQICEYNAAGKFYVSLICGEKDVDEYYELLGLGEAIKKVSSYLKDKDFCYERTNKTVGSTHERFIEQAINFSNAYYRDPFDEIKCEYEIIETEALPFDEERGIFFCKVKFYMSDRILKQIIAAIFENAIEWRLDMKDKEIEPYDIWTSRKFLTGIFNDDYDDLLDLCASKGFSIIEFIKQNYTNGELKCHIKHAEQIRKNIYSVYLKDARYVNGEYNVSTGRIKIFKGAFIKNGHCNSESIKEKKEKNTVMSLCENNILTEDYIFDSPSLAANIILASHVNGKDYFIEEESGLPIGDLPGVQRNKPKKRNRTIGAANR